MTGWPLLGPRGVRTGRRARGLIETWIEDPDGTRIVLVEAPAGHPLRRDPR
jgi:hypothetical protein